MSQIQRKAKLRKKHRKYNYYWPKNLNGLGFILLGGRWCEGTDKK
jgi:hypothetical protein